MEGFLAVFLGFMFIAILAMMTFAIVSAFRPGRYSSGEKVRQKGFRSMKKGSKFMVNGRKAEKISDDQYVYDGSTDALLWDIHNLTMLSLISEPSYSYHSDNSDNDHHRDYYSEHHHAASWDYSDNDDSGSSDSGSDSSGSDD